MGVLIEGVWRDEELPQEVGRAGEFCRADSRFRDRITADGGSGYKAEAGRYHLYVAHEALAHHQKLLSWMVDSLKGGLYLAGERFSNADCAVIPYILRLELLKLSGMWDRYPAVGEWWTRIRARPSVKAAIFDRMTEADVAPFKNLDPDPWPKVQELLRAA